MSAQSLKALQEKIGSVEITMSQFRDRNGLWAKDLSLCVGVHVEFEDSTGYDVELTEFQSLSKEQQELVRHAPSSPKVPS